MFVILSVLVLIAAMNIVSGLIMLVKNKGRDIGILRTMGLTEAERRREGLPAGLEEYYRPFGFDAEFYQQALKAADAVVARAGSMVFELQALRKPAILIPLPHSAGGHQHRNAKFLVERGAAVAIDQRDLKSATLLALIEQVMGDEALRDVARLLLKHSRSFSVVTRYGGDEFAIILVNTSKAGALTYGERIRAVVEQHAFGHGRVTVSLGVACLPDDGTSADDLIAAADRALYDAKRLGRNRVAAP